MSETELLKEIDEQAHGYIELCAMYEKTPSVLGFAEHLSEAYDDEPSGR